MMKLEIYLHFNGEAEKALEFYRECFGGEVTYKQTYGESKQEVPAEWKNRLIHSNFKFGDNMMMISDSGPQHVVQPGSNVTLSIGADNVQEMEKVFNKLAEGGKINMPLQDTFWNARFGMLTDKFGVNWMFNCNLPAKPEAKSL